MGKDNVGYDHFFAHQEGAVADVGNERTLTAVELLSRFILTALSRNISGGMRPYREVGRCSGATSTDGMPGADDSLYVA